MGALETAISNYSLGLKQPTVGPLIRALRQIAQLTQEQFATVLGVISSTLNRWENGHMQPSPLALKQIQFVMHQGTNDPSPFLRDKDKRLLDKYFLEEGQHL